MKDEIKHWKLDLIGHLEDAQILAHSIQDAKEDEEIEKHQPYGYDQTYRGIARDLGKLLDKIRSI
jgi:hypothetical protein